MDRNNIVGLLLIALVLIGFSWWTQPSKEEKRQAQIQDSIAYVQRQKAEKYKAQQEMERRKAAQARIMEDTTALFHAALKGLQQKIVLRNNHVELTLNSKGAYVEKAVIKGYKSREMQIRSHNSKDDSKEPNEVTLFDEKEQKLNFVLSAKETNIYTQDLYFTPSQVSDSTVVFTAVAGPGKELAISYKLGKDILLHTQPTATGLGGPFSPQTNTMDVDWQDKCRQQEMGFSFENRYATLTYHNADGGTDHLNESKANADKELNAPIDWVAFKNQFFSAVMISKNNFEANAKMTSLPQEKGSGYLKQYEAKMKTFFDPSGQKASEFEFYFGPNDFRLLQKVEKESTFGKDLEMQHLVYLGWPLFRLINRWFTIYVFDWLSKIFPMGVVLILITLLLKLITYPMVKKSYMSSAKMRVLKPKLDAATSQYNAPDQQMQKQQAMMAEYQKYGVSPLAGCWPMLIQMPIWIAMFNFVPNAIQLRGQSFLWMHDLSTYDPIVEWGKNLWLIGDHLSLTCILFCVANLLYSWMTMRQQRDQMVGQQAEQMKMMQWMMYLMPLF
ncbi:MAG: membrane protein insertase YidC, partial [Prevotella sp.]